ncbi:uncharacterized protein DUF935, partial [Gemmobacter caeni]
EGADASALSAIINRDVIRPWIQLEFGPQKRYPRIRIGRPKTEDLCALATAVDKMVRLGMEIEEGEIRARFGFSEPKPGARLLTVAAPVSTADLAGSAPLNASRPPDCPMPYIGSSTASISRMPKVSEGLRD